METPNLAEVNLNINQLEELISIRLGFPIRFSVTTHEGRMGKMRIEIKSQELKELAGITKPIYETLKVTDFGGGISDDNLRYWMPIHFSYDFVKGGSNGATICTAQYVFADEKWTVYDI